MRFSRSTHLLMCLFLETLTSMIRTGQPILVEMIDLVRSAINNLAQMVNFPTLFLDGDSHSPALLDLFISSDTSICSTMAFPPLGNSDHVVVSVSTDFSSNSQQDAPFYHIAYAYSCADRNGLHSDILPHKDISKLLCFWN